MAITCPGCGAASRVTRTVSSLDTAVRTRACTRCGAAFATVEAIIRTSILDVQRAAPAPAAFLTGDDFQQMADEGWTQDELGNWVAPT